MLTICDPSVYIDRRRLAVFLDRDGVLIENRDGHVCSTDDVQVIPGAPQAVCMLQMLGYLPIIVTNQSVIGQGGISKECALAVHHHVLALFRHAGARFGASYLCPHTPVEECHCRKPRPGMLERAIESFDIDVGRSVLVGDAYTDIRAADAVGLASALVLTGRGADEVSQIPTPHPVLRSIYADVSAFAEALTMPSGGAALGEPKGKAVRFEPRCR